MGIVTLAVAVRRQKREKERQTPEKIRHRKL